MEYLAKKIPLIPELLYERYIDKELRPYLAREGWHDKTLDFWRDAYFRGQ